MPGRFDEKHSPYEGVDLVEHATFVIGAEAANIINVAVQLQDADHKSLAQRGACRAFLSTDAEGDNIAPTAPSGGVAVGTNGVAIPLIAGKAWELISNATGQIDVNITEIGVATWYLILIMPDGAIVASGAITFA